MKTIVMKFGGASVATPNQFAHIALLIQERKRHFSNVIVVVSAMANMTDQLIRLSKQVNPNPPQREYDMLVTVGERISTALLAMALAAIDVDAVSFTGSQSGIITCAQHTDAKIIDVKPKRVKEALEMGKVVIIAGFQGVSKKGEITTLGRGGSDTSAVAIGAALGAECVEFYKDVPGIFTEDPKISLNAEFLPQINYTEALNIIAKGAKVLHHRSVILAEKNNLPLYVRSFLTSESTKETIIIDTNKIRQELPLYEEASHE